MALFLSTPILGFIRSFPQPAKSMLILGLAIVLSTMSMAILAPYVAPYDPTSRVYIEFQPPTWSYLMGTNHVGMDVFSRIVWGSRVVLFVVAASAAISMAFGVPLGLISGYYGGLVDRVLSIIMDSIYAFPSLILAIAVAAVLGPSPLNAAISIAIVYVPTYYRMVRGETLKVKQMPFIEALIVLGCSDATVFKSILRNITQTILVVFSLSVADAILTEAALSFLGLSVTWPTPDWGLDLRSGQPHLLNGYWWISMCPGLMIIALSLGFALIGEALSDYFSITTKV
ncbi:MAG: ABC transporter permease [Desulfurococcaceae archaeon]